MKKSADVFIEIDGNLALWAISESMPTVSDGELPFLAADIHHPVMVAIREAIRAEETA